MSRSVLAVALLMAAMGATKAKPPTDALSPKLHEVIENVAAAYSGGDIEKVWHLLVKPANGLNENLAAKFDEALAAKKLPAARELLVQARLKLLLEGRTSALPAPSLRERLLILASLQGHLQNPLEASAGQSLVKDDLPAPKNMDEFDRRFHDIHDLQAKLWLARSCASYASDLAGRVPAAARKKLTDKEQETVAHSEGDLLKTVQNTEQDVRELELETRLLRLKYGVEVLQQTQLTKEKFIAAATTRQDARALKYELEPPTSVTSKGAKTKAVTAKSAAIPPAPVVFHRPALTSPDLANEVATLARYAQEAAGSLADKAERFFAGIEFWLRGRYGWGPEVDGLAKSSAAFEKPELLQQVYMPENLLSPADEKKEKPKQPDSGKRTETRPTMAAPKPWQMPKCPDRRHHYTWAWEDRRLLTTTSASGGEIRGNAPFYIDANTRDHNGRTFAQEMQLSVALHLGPDRLAAYGNRISEHTPWAHANMAYQSMQTTVLVPSQDPRLVYRIVGFVEYAQAVQHLDKFVEEATIAEFEAAEEVIRSQGAFRLDTNLSRKIEGPSTLSERSPNPRDDFSRHGLEWMLALARVELGAMLAGFTSHAEPFLSLAPTTFKQERVKTVPFGTAAYGELLMDGLRAHYWSIVREDLIANYYNTGVPENHLLTYGRRAIIGRQFVRAALQFSGGGSGRGNLPGPQGTELQTWEQTFEKLQRIMLYCLTYKVGQIRSTQETRTKYQETVLYGEYKKLVSSTATEQRDTPDGIRRILLLADPTLAGCGCK